MSREIKFRAWDSRDKCFVSDSNFAFQLDGKVFARGGLTFMPEMNITAISQFTGSKDKKGTEIFEGDIVEGEFINDFGSASVGKAKVGWCEHNNAWALFPIPIVEKAEHYVLGSTGTLEVLGNEYQNPELLQ